MLPLFLKFKRFIKFVSLLRTEVYLIFIGISLVLKGTPLEILLQDKLCRNKYKMSEDFCINLPKLKDYEENYEIKSQILSDVVQYNMYHMLLKNIPSIIWSLFLGPWIDKYINGRKAIFLLGSLTQAIETGINVFNSYYFNSDINYVLLSFFPYALSGSLTWMTVYSYMAITTPNKYRTLRMTVLEVLLAITLPIAGAASGRLLMMRPIGGNGQLNNYGFIFGLCTVSSLLAFFWALFMIDQERDKKSFHENFGEIEELNDLKKDLKEDNTEVEENFFKSLKLLFKISNIKEIFKSCIKKRNNYVRAQIWLVIVGMFCQVFVTQSPGSFNLQFAEKIYNWNAETYSYVNSIASYTHTICMMVLTPIFIKVFKMNDMIISIIGFVSIFFQLLTRGTILTPMGFYISVAVSGTYGLAGIGFKSYIGKIVDPSELGKVFTLMSVIDAIAPLIASSLFTILFRITIDRMPGTCYLVLSAICLIPIIIAIVIDIMIRRINVRNIDNSEKSKDSDVNKL